MWLLKNIILLKNWLAFYRGSLHLELRNGLVIDLPTRDDICIVHEVIADRTYGRFIGNERTILDIGAHIGTFTLLALKETNARVICYEPSSRNFAYLTRNIEQNGFANRVELHRQAVAKEPGIATLHLSAEGDTGHNSLTGNGFVVGGTEQVECVTLDSITTTNPCDLLKIDCEDAEPEILSSSDLSRVGRIVAEAPYL
ncbi:FkbM family methyltransferase [Candidatus Parcubacteria bacterium]|nr:MAG: FkbM family methyltransferase [Candidatus Parcubacteria bacterium]